MGLKKSQAEEYAKMLFLDTSQKLTQKEIAERVGVRPNTVGKWIAKEGWEKLRKSMLATRQNMISDLYDQLENLNNIIKTRKITYDIPESHLKPIKVKLKDGSETLEFPKIKEEDYPIKVGNFPTSSEANTQAVITRSIKQLETETSIAEVYEVSTSLLDFIKPIDFEMYQKLIPYCDAFINNKIA